MIKYKVENIPGADAQLVWGNFMPGSVPVNLPDDEPLAKKYTSLFLHQKDIEAGLDCLHQIQAGMSIHIVYALFTTALVHLLKCFQQSDNRVALNENTFFKKHKDVKDSFSKFKEWRNGFFVHDGNGMTRSNAYILLAPEGAATVLGGPVSVGWMTEPIDYIQESIQLEQVMQKVWRFVCNDIDATGAILNKKYEQKTREELLSYGIIGRAVFPGDQYTIEEIKAMRPPNV